MAAGHPKPSLGSLKLCFEMSTARTFKMQVWMAMDHRTEHFGCLQLCFGVPSVVAAVSKNKNVR